MASVIKDKARLRRILDLSDRLGNLRRRMKAEAGPISRRDLSEEIHSIASSVVTIGLPGALGMLEKEHHLSPQEVMILLLLLNRRIEPGNCVLSGREILSTLFPTAYETLAGIALLSRDGRIRACGAVDVVEEGESVLESRFGINDRLFAAIEKDVNPDRGRSGDAPAYRSHFEHLADLSRLATILMRRSNARFDRDPYDFYGRRAAEPRESVARLDRRAAVLVRRIRDRLAVTTGAHRYPLFRLAAKHRLNEKEQLLLVALLTQACFFGSVGMDAVDCVRLISRTPEELLRNHDFLAASCRLRRENLIEVDDSLEDFEMTTEVSLPRWVALYLLGDATVRPDDPIDPDTRIEFHEYLKELEDSDRFYRDLGA